MGARMVNTTMGSICVKNVILTVLLVRWFKLTALLVSILILWFMGMCVDVVLIVTRLIMLMEQLAVKAVQKQY